MDVRTIVEEGFTEIYARMGHGDITGAVQKQEEVIAQLEELNNGV